MNDLPIGVFDSGVGGLTVAHEIARQLPNERLIYFGDTERCPYGPRDLDEVRGFVLDIVAFLASLDVKLVVIACNTGTAAGLKAAQERFDVPVIGVIEPGARGAAEATRSRRVGVIGTVGTIASGSYVEALAALDAGLKVTQQACPEFVDFVERGEIYGPRIEALADGYLAPIRAADVDALILGCTHYPLITPMIAARMAADVTIVSSADETAREVGEILERRGHLRPEGPAPTHRFLATGDVVQFLELGGRILGYGITEVEKVSLAGDRPLLVPDHVARR